MPAPYGRDPRFTRPRRGRSRWCPTPSRSSPRRSSTLGLGFLFWLVAARLFRPSRSGWSPASSPPCCCASSSRCSGWAPPSSRSSRRTATARGGSSTRPSPRRCFSRLAAGRARLLAWPRRVPRARVVGTPPAFPVLFLAMSALGRPRRPRTGLDDTAPRRARRSAAASSTARSSLVGPRRARHDRPARPAGPWRSSRAGSPASRPHARFGAAQLGAALGATGTGPASVRWRAPPVAVGCPTTRYLADRAPGLLLPVLVTELLSPTANAYWYAVWMMAWVVFVIPVQVGMTLFAEASHRPHAIDALVRHAIRSSLGSACARPRRSRSRAGSC